MASLSTAPTGETEDEVQLFLRSHNLEEYYAKLINAGYDSLSRLKNLELVDLVEDIGMKKGHARQLLREIASLVNLQQYPSESYQSPNFAGYDKDDLLLNSNDLESTGATSADIVFAEGGECDLNCELLMHEVCRTIPEGSKNCGRVLQTSCCCGRIPAGQMLEYLRLSFGVFTAVESIAFVYAIIQLVYVMSIHYKNSEPGVVFLFSCLTLVLNFLINGIWVVTVTKHPQMCCCSRKINAVGFCLFQTAHVVMFLFVLVMFYVFVEIGAFGVISVVFFHSEPKDNVILRNEGLWTWSAVTMNFVYLIACIIMWIFNVRSLLWLWRCCHGRHETNQQRSNSNVHRV